METENWRCGEICILSDISGECTDSYLFAVHLGAQGETTVLNKRRPPTTRALIGFQPVPPGIAPLRAVNLVWCGILF